MKMTSASEKNDRFHSGAQEYALYLDTPEGRLRSDLAFASVEDFLPRLQDTKSLRALDVGCGTGALGIRLARLGIQVTLLDSSQPMLDIARSAAESADLTNKITLHHGDVAQLPGMFPSASFDLILCHNTLEFLDGPAAVLRGLAGALRNSSALLSILVRNRAGEVFKAAIQSGDLAAAEANFSAEWGQESLYGGRVRLFAPEDLRALLKTASLETIAERGVRVLADYLPPRVSRTDEYPRIFGLERKLGIRPEYAAIARYTHFLAHRKVPASAPLSS